MKIIEPSYEIIDRDHLLTPAQKIERVGRICYKSEDKITDTSAVPFVRRLIENGHEAMLEHASILTVMNRNAYKQIRELCSSYEEGTGNPCLLKRSNGLCDDFVSRYFVSGNIRAWRDVLRFGSNYLLPQGLQMLFTYYPELFEGVPKLTFTDIDEDNLCIITPAAFQKLQKDSVTLERHETLTVKFNVDIAVARELCRHRLASHAGASTRYCDYAGGKFGGETTVVMPEEDFSADWARAAHYAEDKYLAQRQDGISPEIARSALTVSTLAEHVVTATLDEWKHIFRLRALDKTGKAHPQMKQVMLPLYQECREWLPEVFGNLENE